LFPSTITAHLQKGIEDPADKSPDTHMDPKVAVALTLSLVGGLSTSLGMYQQFTSSRCTFS